jgi:glutathione S-transferase
MDALSNEVYKHHRDVVYTVMGFMPGPADQAAATAAYMAAMDKWGKTFLKGKFVLGDKLSIADFKAVPYLWAAICCEPKVDGLKVPAQIKEYVDAFFGAVDAAKILKEYSGYSIAEYTASRDKLAQ